MLSLWLLPWLLCGAAATLAVAWMWYTRKEQRRIAGRFRDALQILMYPKDGELWKALHPRARDAAEKPLVLALQRAVHGEMGKPKQVHTSTLELLNGAPKGFTRCRALVEFDKGNEGLVHICWEEGGSDRPLTGPQSGPRLLELRVDPDSKQLDLAKYVKPESLEQKTDEFLNHLFHGRTEKAYTLMDDRLREKLTRQQLEEQQRKVLVFMGVSPGRDWEVDTAFDKPRQHGPLALFLTARLCGESQDAIGEFLWAFDTMASKLLKFEVKTTGKAKKETVFVNPDGTRIDPDSLKGTETLTPLN